MRCVRLRERWQPTEGRRFLFSSISGGWARLCLVAFSFLILLISSLSLFSSPNQASSELNSTGPKVNQLKNQSMSCHMVPNRSISLKIINRRTISSKLKQIIQFKCSLGQYGSNWILSQNLICYDWFKNLKKKNQYRIILNQSNSVMKWQNLQFPPTLELVWLDPIHRWPVHRWPLERLWLTLISAILHPAVCSSGTWACSNQNKWGIIRQLA